MTIKQYRARAIGKLSLAVLFGITLLGACSQEESDQQPTSAEETRQQQSNPDIDIDIDEKVDASIQADSAPAQKGVAQFAMIDVATAEIKAASGSKVEGKVAFKPGPERKMMQVEVRLSGLEVGDHGIHIHEIGDCSAADATSAGGHFNPYDASHGGPGKVEHHTGDMGNVTADEQGEVDTTLSFDFLAFSGPANILEKAVVVHAGGDDLETDPAGDAGKRVGCGVIQADRDVLAPEA